MDGLSFDAGNARLPSPKEIMAPIASTSSAFIHVADEVDSSITPDSVSSSFVNGGSLMQRQLSSNSIDSENPTPSSGDYDQGPSHVESPEDSPYDKPKKNSKPRRRTTTEQLKVLEAHFANASKPEVALRKDLADQLSMTPREVQVWFQNRRAKAKKLAARAAQEADASQEPVTSEPLSLHDASAWEAAEQDHRPLVTTTPEYAMQQYLQATGPSTLPPHWPIAVTNPEAVPQLYEGDWSPHYAANAPSWPPPLSMAESRMTNSALRPSPLSIDPIGMLPFLPITQGADSQPSSTSTSEYTHYSFGDISGLDGRRDSVASLDSLLTEASEAQTVSGQMTPASAAMGATFVDAHFDEQPPPLGGDLQSRRASCPAGFIASFETTHLHQPAATSAAPAMEIQQWINRAHPPAPPPSMPLPPPAHLLHDGLMGELGRRHSLALPPSAYMNEHSLMPSMWSGEANSGNRSPIRETMAVRRGSVPSLLATISEHAPHSLSSSPGGIGAHRRNSAARKIRSQISLQPLGGRPAAAVHPNAYSDEGTLVTDGDHDEEGLGYAFG